MQILLADDDVITRSLLKVYLEQWGHFVQQADDGAAAWRLLQEQTFHLVMTDWMMPGMTGIELIRKIRTSDHAADVYIILLTSNSEKTAMVTGLTTGADDYLTKPVDPNELKARLQPCLRIVELERRLAERNRELESRNQQLAETNAKTKRDLTAAARIQQSFLPSRVQDISGVQFAWHYSPCHELAGDMLNIFQLDEDHVGVYVLDVSGHGVQASLLAVTACRNLMSNHDASSVLWQRRDGSTDYSLLPPSAAVRKLNSRFVAQSINEQYFTLVYGILNKRTGVFRYCLAGHPGPVLLDDSGRASLLPGSGLPIGLMETHFDEHQVQLRPGDRVVLYSDGVTECMNIEKQLFGGERLLEALQSNTDPTIDGAVSKVVNQVTNWAGSAPVRDDLSLLAFEYSPEGTSPSHLAHAGEPRGFATEFTSAV